MINYKTRNIIKNLKKLNINMQNDDIFSAITRLEEFLLVSKDAYKIFESVFGLTKEEEQVLTKFYILAEDKHNCD
jgi:glutaredoxin-related protein